MSVFFKHRRLLNTQFASGGMSTFMHFYPRDAIASAVFATATCPSVCPDVRHTPVLCENGAFPSLQLDTGKTAGCPVGKSCLSVCPPSVGAALAALSIDAALRGPAVSWATRRRAHEFRHEVTIGP